MALVTDCNSVTAGVTGHIDGNTTNAPKTHNPDGTEVNAVQWGTISAVGTDGSIHVQQVIGYEKVENSHPATYQRIDTGSGYGDWLKIG